MKVYNILDMMGGDRPMPEWKTRRERLARLAATQAGYFTGAQARDLGYSSRSLVYHVKVGNFERISPGFYRLREFPAVEHEDVIAGWVKAGKSNAVVSHETALVLYDLVPLRPRHIDLTVPRSRRPYGASRQLPAVKIHTSTRPLGRRDVIERFGVRVTSPPRTIVDAAEAGTDPSVILEASTRAIRTGLVTATALRDAATDRSERVRKLIDRAISEAMRAPVR